jgi:hypothetical protein
LTVLFRSLHAAAAAAVLINRFRTIDAATLRSLEAAAAAASINRNKPSMQQQLCTDQTSEAIDFTDRSLRRCVDSLDAAAAGPCQLSTQRRCQLLLHRSLEAAAAAAGPCQLLLCRSINEQSMYCIVNCEEESLRRTLSLYFLYLSLWLLNPPKLTQFRGNTKLCQFRGFRNERLRYP